MTAENDLNAAVSAAWREFLTRYEPLRPTLYRYCRHLTRAPWDAEDLVQDTLARAFSTIGTLHDPPSDPRAWLFRIASNLWIDRVRRSGATLEPGDDSAAPPSQAIREAAGTLLAQLSPQERAAVVLKDAFGVTLEEIAGMLSTSVGAVKAALHRGRGKLAEPKLETPRVPVPRTLDAFCRAFNAGDLDGVAALLLDDATVEVVGASTLYGSSKARTALNGMIFGSRRMAALEDGGTCNGIDPHFIQGALPTPARVEIHEVRGVPLLFSWYRHHDGEFVRAVTRVELDEATGHIARIWNYFFTPEVIAELCGELGFPCRTNGTFRARVASEEGRA